MRELLPDRLILSAPTKPLILTEKNEPVHGLLLYLRYSFFKVLVRQLDQSLGGAPMVSYLSFALSLDHHFEIINNLYYN